MTLFTFGCSFTQYAWPTWADIAGQEFESYENWGLSGGGNQFIFHSLMECVVKNKISKDDVVVIMWTNITREDRYVKGAWLTPGNLFHQNTYTNDFVEKFADTRGYFIRDVNIITATDIILKNIGCKFYFLSMIPLTNADQYFYNDIGDDIEDLLDFFQPILDFVRPSIYEVIFNFDWTSRPFTIQNKIAERKIHYNLIKDLSWPEWNDHDETEFIAGLSDNIKKECYEKFHLDFYHNNRPLFQRVDYHPTPLEHLEYLEKVLPEISISKKTKEWTIGMDVDVKLNKCNWHVKNPTRW